MPLFTKCSTVLCLLVLCSSPCPGQTTTSSATATTATEVQNRLQPAPPPRKAEPGKVLPTASGDQGGATIYTRSLPLDGEGLAELRRPFTIHPEFRGAWVTRFDWAGGRGQTFSPQSARKRIRQIMRTARELNLNAVLFQVRGDATTLYPSTLEPWSQLVGGKDPGFDPVRFAIREARKNGLEFHAYINPVPCSEERTTAPASADHIYHKRCTSDAVPNWLVHKDGKPAPFHEYLWFNPNLPQVQTYIRDVVMDFVKRYDVDGIHFDRIRLPGPDVSDDPWSKERFEGGANPSGLPYNEWQAENITRMLIDIYASIMEVKPRIKVSSAVWGIYDNTQLPEGTDKATGYSWTSSGLQDFMQDSVGWINRGCMDAIIPMIYWNMGDIKPDYDELLLTFKSGIRNGRHLYGGQRVFSNEEMLRQTVATNLIGAHGTVPFTLNRISREGTAEYYKEKINPVRVATPAMPWKSRPLDGHLITVVKNAKGEPVVDAQVRVKGRDEVALSSADGLCAFVSLKPGDLELTVSRQGAGEVSRTARVDAGKVTRLEVTLPETGDSAPQGE